MRRLIIAAAAAAFAATAAAQTPAPSQTRERGALVYDGIPEVPTALAERLARYGNARSAAFADWLPDGSMLISTRFGSTAQIHRVAAPGADRRQLTFFAEPIGGALARPGGSGEFVFGKDTGGDEYFQGYSTGLTGFETAFTEPKTRNQSYTFSRDGRQLAWSRVTPGDGNYDIMLMTPGDVKTRRVVLEGTGAIAPADVSDDGRTLLLTKYLSIAEGELYRLDATSGRLTEINPTDGKIAYGGAELTPDGRSVLVTSDEGSDVLQLVRIDLATGRKTPLTPGLKWTVENFDLSDDGRTLAVVVNEDGLSKVMLRDFGSGRELPAPPLPPAVVGGLKFSPDGRRLGMTVSTARGTDAYSWDVRERRLTRWTESELGGLDPALLEDARVVRFRSFDGRMIPAIVERAKARTPGRAPVLINIHGGPEGQERPGFSAGVAAWMLELGAVVISPNVRGSEGYGKAYLALDNAEKREDSVKDIGALLDWIATQPDLDPERVVVTGGSYGGYMVLASLVNYSDRLAGGVDIVGISNFITFLTNTEGYRRDLRRVEYGDERDPAMRAVFERISPLNNTARIKTPLLVIQGDNDPRVPKSEADQVVAKVRAQGNEVWYLRARNEGHGFSKKENRDGQREVEMMFLRKVLKLDLSR